VLVSVIIPYVYQINKHKLIWSSNLSMSRRQFGLFSPTQSSSTPESHRQLTLMSSSFRREFEDCRTDDTSLQHWSVSLQPTNLNRII